MLALSLGLIAQATEPTAPLVTHWTWSNGSAALRFPPFPGAQAYTFNSGTNLFDPLAFNANFLLSPYVISSSASATNYGYEWRATNQSAPVAFYRVVVTPMDPSASLAATALSRLTYGPTPDELNRIASVGPDAYIAEQLAPWSIAEDVTASHTNLPFIEAKFVAANQFVPSTGARMGDLRAWHVLRAIGARRQLLEILLQFWENHFVTQYSKTSTWFDNYYDDGTIQGALAAQTEYLENARWRAALLKPDCTFYDLLKISAESPAMIIYLDSVVSRGDGSNIANENYARELLELFTMGVDNGYDQNDITVGSRIWTGWRVEKVALTNAENPFAPLASQIIPGSTNTSTTTKSNLFGVWAFNYKTNYHNTSTKAIFPSKSVSARFGPPWTTRTYGTNTAPGAYQIVIPGHSRTDTNGISEGYQFLRHIANLPFTQEYLSIKLCRLLVHDDFPNPSNDPMSAEYGFYNYTAGNLSPEADLVRQCMLTWETNSPQGQIWKVLETIVKSDLFRGQGAVLQKVKDPLEYVISAVRALRSSTNGTGVAGSFTAWSDGYAISGSSSSSTTPLTRMGAMLLFDRDSPDGYPEAGPAWISAGTLSERLRWIQSFCIANGQPGHTSTTNDAGSTVSDIGGLLRAHTAPATWTNAVAATDYFLSVLYPGEGAANLSLYRAAAIKFLNDGTADSPASTVPFEKLAVSSSATSNYDRRLRGMVGMLMTMPRFQEQ
jgi:uncharacterized protein (DUF1800 family)